MNLTDEQIFELLPFKPEIGKKYYFFDKGGVNGQDNRDLILAKTPLSYINKIIAKEYIDVKLEFGDRRNTSYKYIGFRIVEKDKKLICDEVIQTWCNIAFETKEAAISFLTKKLTESEVEEL